MGTDYELTDGLTISPLLELEYSRASFDLRGRRATTSHYHDTSEVFQAGLEATFTEELTGELVYEFDASAGKHQVEEASVTFELDLIELDVGRLFVPFGVYSSYFVSGPALEFGETNGEGLIATWNLEELTEISLFTYYGQAKRPNSSLGMWDWGVSITTSLSDTGNIGVSFISDLADSEEEFLQENGNRYSTKVSAFGTFIQIGIADFELGCILTPI